MTYEEWVEKYRPIKNEIDANANFDGTMFETFGEELDFVRAQPDPRCIWTYICGEADTITSGWHLVNRMGYFITEVPFEGDFLEIDIDDPEDDKGQLRYFDVFAARDGETYIDWVEAQSLEEAKDKARAQIAGVFTSIDVHPQEEPDEFEGELDGFHVSEPEFPDGSFIYHEGTGTLIAASECQVISAEAAAEVQ